MTWLLANTTTDNAARAVGTFLPRLAGALALLIIGLIVARLIARLVARSLVRDLVRPDGRMASARQRP